MLKHCATSRKVGGSIPDGAIGIFHSHNPSGRTMAPGVHSASNRNEYQEYFLEGKGDRCVGLTTLPPSCADYLEIWEPEPPGTLRACPGITFYIYIFATCFGLYLGRAQAYQYKKPCDIQKPYNKYCKVFVFICLGIT